MSTMADHHVPALDLNDFTQGGASGRQQFVRALGNAYQEIGFVAVRNHFLTDELAIRLYALIKDFFAMEDAVKQKYEIPSLAGQRGYIGKGKEHAKGRHTGDLKEFYHIGQELQDEDTAAQGYPANIWPEEIPQMKDTALMAYRALEQTGATLLKAVALYLGLAEDYFTPKITNGNSILRAIYYYPIADPEKIPAGAVRAAEHGDINLITLLMGASADGLQLLRRDGTWIPVTALPDQLVVNVGDMLERLTNGKLKSTIHRVVNPPRHLMQNSRYSIPFFMHPRSDMSLAALDNCVGSGNPRQWEDITAGEFLSQRLKEIGLKK